MMDVKIDEQIVNDAKNYILQISNEDMLLDKVSTRKLNQLESLNMDIVSEMKDVGGTAFGLFQGVTKYTSHTVKQKEEVFGNIFGTVANINKRAYEFATALI
jgi:hypothetical protein